MVPPLSPRSLTRKSRITPRLNFHRSFHWCTRNLLLIRESEYLLWNFAIPEHPEFQPILNQMTVHTRYLTCGLGWLTGFRTPTDLAGTAAGLPVSYRYHFLHPTLDAMYPLAQKFTPWIRSQTKFSAREQIPTGSGAHKTVGGLFCSRFESPLWIIRPWRT